MFTTGQEKNWRLSGFSRLVSNCVSLRTFVVGYILFPLKVENKEKVGSLSGQMEQMEQ